MHTVTQKEHYGCCAFTQLVVNFCKMMTDRGHTVIHYGAEGSTPVCTEHVTTVTRAQQQAWFRYDWDKGEGFPDVVYERDKPYWVASNLSAVAEVGKRLQPGDFICLISECQRMVADAYPNHASVEYAIGYPGTFAPYRVFCSRAFQHYVYGRDRQGDGRIGDAVIPHYFDPDDFPLGAHDGDYYMFLGRLTTRKGPHLAGMICEKIGAKLVLAGNGITYKEPGRIASVELSVYGRHCEHVGVAGPERRAELLGKAKALFVLTQYIGPFEMVAVEAMMCGTPVITSDWGAFSEWVIDGFNGFRVNTIGEGMAAAQRCVTLDHTAIRQWAVEKFSLAALAPHYEAYFERVRRLRAQPEGWFNESPGEFAEDDESTIEAVAYA